MGSSLQENMAGFSQIKAEDGDWGDMEFNLLR